MPIKQIHNVAESLSLQKEIGKGSFGVVYLGVVARGNTKADAPQVAVKTIDLTSTKVKENSLRREIDLLYRSRDCTGLPQLYDVLYNDAEQKLYLVLEYVKGVDMFKYIYGCNGRDKKHENPVTSELPQFIRVVETLATGLWFLHEAGIAHRDIKLANAMIDPITLDVKWIDLGLAVSESGGDQNEKCVADGAPTPLLGTPSTMAPEVILGVVTSWRGADVWSFGCTVHEYVTQLICSAQRKLLLLKRALRDETRTFDDVRDEIKMYEEMYWGLSARFDDFPLLGAFTQELLVFNAQQRWNNWTKYHHTPFVATVAVAKSPLVATTVAAKSPLIATTVAAKLPLVATVAKKTPLAVAAKLPLVATAVAAAPPSAKTTTQSAKTTASVVYVDNALNRRLGRVGRARRKSIFTR